MPTVLLPARVNLTAQTEQQVTATRLRAIYRGDSREYTGQVVDAYGDPFDLGPTNSPRWTFQAEVRSGTRQGGGTVLCTFTVTVDDGPLGLIRWKLAAGATDDVTDDVGNWDLQMVNDSDSNFDDGWTQTVFEGAVTFLGDVTE